MNETLGVLAHVVGRRHVHLAARDFARQAGVRLAGEFLGGDSSYLFDRVEHHVRTDGTIQSGDVGARAIEPLRDYSRTVAVDRPIVGSDRHLRDDGQRTDVANRRHALFHFRDVRHRLEDEQIDAAVPQRLGLFAKVLARFVECCWTVRLDADAERPDRAGDVYRVASGLTRNLHRFQIDLAQIVFNAERPQLDSIRAIRVGLEDLGARADVLLVHFQDDLRRPKIQLVVALVDEDAFGVEHRPHRAVEEVDVLVCNCLYEILHV